MTTKPVKIRAHHLFSEWRADGIPAVVTAHEAWRLSGGLAGKQADHGTAIPLAQVAVKVAQSIQTKKDGGTR